MKKKSLIGKKVFENLRLGKKDTGIKMRLNSSIQSMRKNNKLMKGVSYGNDLNYQRYMIYLDKVREDELDLEENLKKEKENKNHLANLKKDNILSKKISFSEFSNKFQINPFLLEYFDYYEIQKINRKELEKNLKAKKNKEPQLEIDEDSSELESEEEKNNFIISNRNVNITDTNLNNKYSNHYENLITNSYIKTKTLNNKTPKNFKKIYIPGIDFNLINKVSSETNKVNKKIERLNYLKEIRKQKEIIAKKISKALNDPNSKNKNINYNIDDLIDGFTIFHTTEPRNIRKLNRLKFTLGKNIDENIPKKSKLSKTIYHNNPTYFLYIPKSAKYRHISYHKDCIFNQEFNSNKKTKKKSKISLKKEKNKFSEEFLNDTDNISKISYLLKTQKNFFHNSNPYFLSSNDNLKTKSNKIIRNLKEIKSLLKQDRNYTSKTINRANAKFHQNERIKQDQKLMEGVMGVDDRKNISKMRAMQKKRKNKKINENNNVFTTLKKINDEYDKDKKIYSEMNLKFTHSLNVLTKVEKKENKAYKKILKNNYHLKLENDESGNEIKIIKKNIDNKQYIVNSLNAKINKKILEINDIITQSHKKTQNTIF